MKNKLLLASATASLLLLGACAAKPTSPVSAASAGKEAPLPTIADPTAETRMRAISLREKAVEALYSKDPKVKDPAKAYELFLEAAGLGDPISMDQVGGFHSSGLAGKEKSCKLAAEWFEKSAAAGYDLAANNLAYTLVSCDDKKFRDAQKAEDIMQMIFGRNQSFVALIDTYATVLAEQGKFQLATKAMDVAIDIAELVRANAQRLDEMKKTRELFAKKKRIDATKEADPHTFRKTK